MKVKAYGKVNLALDVVRAREDGYHDLDMIMAPIDICDNMEIEMADEDEILCDSMHLPANNTLLRTLDLLRKKAGLKHHYKISVEKKIPAMAGLGGGSADAAALIKALNTLEHLQLSVDDMMELGKEVGADVPFCILGGYARVQGIGEKCRPIYSQWKIPVLLVQPGIGMSTPAAFGKWDEEERKHYDVDIIQDALEKKDIALLYQTMANGLEPIVMDELPILNQIKEDMNECGLVRVMMTGSGSCMMGFCVEESLIDAAAEKLSDKYPFVAKAWIGWEEEA